VNPILQQTCGGAQGLGKQQWRVYLLFQAALLTKSRPWTCERQSSQCLVSGCVTTPRTHKVGRSVDRVDDECRLVGQLDAFAACIALFADEAKVGISLRDRVLDVGFDGLIRLGNHCGREESVMVCCMLDPCMYQGRPPTRSRCIMWGSTPTKQTITASAVQGAPCMELPRQTDSRSTRFFLVFGLSMLAACEVLFADPSRMRFPASLARLTVNAYTRSRSTSVGAIFAGSSGVCKQAAAVNRLLNPSQGTAKKILRL
jgi:hypothetical protein